MQADEIGLKFGGYGDFNVVKDSQNSCYIEFYYYDENEIKGENKLEQVL